MIDPPSLLSIKGEFAYQNNTSAPSAPSPYVLSWENGFPYQQGESTWSAKMVSRNATLSFQGDIKNVLVWIFCTPWCLVQTWGGTFQMSGWQQLHFTKEDITLTGSVWLQGIGLFS
jgi:hypothetical protein